LVLGPDLLANTLLLIAIHPIYVLFGPVGLAALYLLSACLNTLYFFLFTKVIDRSHEITHRIQLYVALFLVSPIFFLWDGSVYSGSPLDASSGARIENLPLPLAIFSGSIGVAILGNCAAIKRSMGFLLSIVLIFFLILVSLQVVIARALDGAIRLALGLAVFTICHCRDRVMRNQMAVGLVVLATASILY
jgi:hypothetical protein